MTESIISQLINENFDKIDSSITGNKVLMEEQSVYQVKEEKEINTNISNVCMYVDTWEMHTCGMPVRIATKVKPHLSLPTPLEQYSVSEIMSYFAQNLDHIRRAIMLEPRGHKDMFGALLLDYTFVNNISVSRKKYDYELGVLFLTTSGYGTMCGHASISIGRYVLENYRVLGFTPQEPETNILLHCPCGDVELSVEWRWTSKKKGVVGKTTFRSVAAFLYLPQTVLPETSIYMNFDIAYGGNFFIIIDKSEFGIEICKEKLTDIMNQAKHLMKVVETEIFYDAHRALVHPISGIHSSIFGVMIISVEEDEVCMDVASHIEDVKLQKQKVLKTLSVFGNKGSVDRSPCGSGTTATMATLYTKGLIDLNEQVISMNMLTGDRSSECGHFMAQVVESEDIVNRKAEEMKTVTVNISGRGTITGRSTWVCEQSDHLWDGFLL